MTTPNSWECAFCRRRSRAEKRIVLTNDNGRAGVERVRCCDLECLRRLLAWWEELETYRLDFSDENEPRTYFKDPVNPEPGHPMAPTQEWLDANNQTWSALFQDYRR
jgi:hypothetical protein